MLRLSDIMTGKVVTVTPDTTLREATELFASLHISGAPVVRRNKVVGVVSAADVLAFAANTRGASVERSDETRDDEWTKPVDEDTAEDEHTPSSSRFSGLWADNASDDTRSLASTEIPEWDALDDHTVGEVMTRDLWALAPDDDVFMAADLMRQRAIHRVIIVDDGLLVGIVSALDITRAVADHKVAVRTYVFNHDRDFRAPGFPT